MTSRPDATTGSLAAPGRRFTYADYAGFPEDGRRYEIIDGTIHVSPAPVPEHQRVLGRLYLLLGAWAREHRPTEAFLAPIDLILADDTVVQPDLLIVTEPGSVSGRGIERAPALVVEILSPSTRDRDRTIKRERYARAGVREYWLVDPDALAIEQHVLAPGGTLEFAAVLHAGDELRCRAVADLVVPVAQAFGDA